MSYPNPLKARFAADYLRGIPELPGVYFMHDETDGILYIGKAKCLRKRLSSYFNAKPGMVPEHTLEMIDLVRKIRWQVRESEEDALDHESQLLRAVRPPYNIAGTEPDEYLFIGLRRGAVGTRTSTRLEFQLSRRESIRDEGFRLFGCYRHRIETKSAYTALLRLIHAAHARETRYRLPAKISRATPPWQYSVSLEPSWDGDLEKFLDGKNRDLLHRLVERLLENENIPEFMRPGLQEDLARVRDFFDRGPRLTRRLRHRNGLKDRFVSQSQMEDLILSECESAAEGTLDALGIVG